MDEAKLTSGFFADWPEETLRAFERKLKESRDNPRMQELVDSLNKAVLMEQQAREPKPPTPVAPPAGGSASA